VTTSVLTSGVESISVVRRNLLRACHLLMAVGLGLTAWPQLLTAAPDRPLTEGVVDAVLCAMQLLAVVGVFAPVRLVLNLVLDLLWKVIWVLAVYVPLAVAGEVSTEAAETLFACAFAAPFIVIIPWGAMARDLWTRREPWRRPTSVG
jgi:hypothetical protein